MNTLQNRFVAIGSFLGLTAILLGAMGAHFLRDKLLPHELMRIETGVRYQMYHAILMVALAFSSGRIRSSVLNTVFYLIVAGVIGFSFSIYAFVAVELFSITVPSFLHLITPLGGLSLSAAWLVLLGYAFKNLYFKKKDV